jgi:hypothetical protein
VFVSRFVAFQGRSWRNHGAQQHSYSQQFCFYKVSIDKLGCLDHAKKRSKKKKK